MVITESSSWVKQEPNLPHLYKLEFLTGGEGNFEMTLKSPFRIVVVGTSIFDEHGILKPVSRAVNNVYSYKHITNFSKQLKFWFCLWL